MRGRVDLGIGSCFGCAFIKLATALVSKLEVTEDLVCLTAKRCLRVAVGALRPAKPRFTPYPRNFQAKFQTDQCQALCEPNQSTRNRDLRVIARSKRIG